MKLYSWKDVERYCLLNNDLWDMEFDSIEVYPSEVTAYKKATGTQSVEQVFQKLFPANFDTQTKCIRLDIGIMTIPVFEDKFQETTAKPIMPLFREILYRKSSYPHKELPALPCPLIAFHSYKGGVGRTLSLLAFAKAWSAEFAETEQSKLLIIDSDIEAPGLTWIQDDNYEDAFSYLDILSLIQDNTDIDRIVDLSCSKIGTTTIMIETPTRTVEHIFIPTSRYKEQLVDLYASPDTIVNGKEKEYILAQVISKICKQLGASAALIDLRAGISEFSSTLLLDPRVKKYLVTSTSMQSIKGTQIILEYLMRGLRIQEETILPEVLLSMVPETLPESEKSDIISDLIRCYEQNSLGDETDSYTDHAVTELTFASELIHLTSLHQILQNLNSRDMYLTIQKMVQQNFSENISASVRTVVESDNAHVLERIHDLANIQIAAEGNNEFDLLMTAPLKYLKKKYRDTIPATVVMGAKGSGKTFLYRKLAENQDWFSFCCNMQDQASDTADGFFLPVIASRNVGEMVTTLKNCIDRLNSAISCANAKNDIFLDNQQKLDRQKSEKTDWLAFWENLLAVSFNPAFHTLYDVNTALAGCEKKIVFLVDGLEETLRQVSESETERQAVQALCQDIINLLTARYPNIGAIIFLRRDMAHDAITVNFAQFAQAYERAELKWSSHEALRLAVWLVSQAVKDFYTESVEIDVASQDIIEKYLTDLWGLKLGKSSSNEAYSSRWILAALSDFNGQLQARDIIRFLKYAAVPGAKKAPYNDRILMPVEIKQAVSKCSTEKMEEVKLEYTALKPIFEKLDQLPLGKKVLPLSQSDATLTSTEEKSMIQEGYLKRDGDKYYLPEIVRHALSFKYEKGARPKVLSLLLKN